MTDDAEPGIVNARYVIAALKAAGLRWPFAGEMEHVEVMWAAMLAPFTTEVLEESVREWISADSHDFPSVGEMGTLASSIQRRHNRERALARGAGHVRPGEVCPECGPGRGFVETIAGDVGEPSTLRPCQTCRPAQYEKWQAGAFMPDFAVHNAQGTLIDGEADAPDGWFEAHRIKVSPK